MRRLPGPASGRLGKGPTLLRLITNCFGTGRELERGDPNRATLAVARKMVCYMLAVERRKQDFVPAELFSRNAVA